MESKEEKSNGFTSSDNHLVEDIAQMRKELGDLKSENGGLKAQSKSYRQLVYKQEEKIDEQQAEMEALREEVEKLKARAAQTAPFPSSSRLTPCDSQTQPDEVIWSHLDQLEESLKAWVRQHTIKGFETMYESVKLKNWKQIYAAWEVLQLSPIGRTRMIEELRKSENEQIGGELLVSAWATKFVYREIFKNPIWFTDNIHGSIPEGEIQGTIVGSLSMLWEEIIRCK
jgi:DNA repair exonuclease SbcCD ATPase subunit